MYTKCGDRTHKVGNSIGRDVCADFVCPSHWQRLRNDRCMFFFSSLSLSFFFLLFFFFFLFRLISFNFFFALNINENTFGWFSSLNVIFYWSPFAPKVKNKSVTVLRALCASVAVDEIKIGINSHRIELHRSDESRS